VVHPWRDDELIVIAPAAHPLTSRRTVNVGDLTAHLMLVREPGSGTRVVTERALSLHGVRLTNTMRVGGTEAIKQAVAAGLGLAIVSRAAAADQLMLGRVAKLNVEGLVMRRTLAQIKLHGRGSTPPARELELLLAEGFDGDSVGDASGDPGPAPDST
jgi:DNA-binding transcriptional LysR family regulator